MQYFSPDAAVLTACVFVYVISLPLPTLAAVAAHRVFEDSMWHIVAAVTAATLGAATTAAVTIAVAGAIPLAPWVTALAAICQTVAAPVILDD